MVSTTSSAPDQCYDLDVILSIMRLLSGRTRVEILSVLADGAVDVQGIAERLSLDIKAVSQQLQTMRSARLVGYESVWRCHAYQLGEAVRVLHHPRLLEISINPGLNCAVVMRAPRQSVTNGRARS